MVKSICFYTDNRIKEPVRSLVRRYIKESGLDIVSCSLKGIQFGKNIVINGKRSYPTMINQIITCLENSISDYVFFCEHDVLYPKSHFDFTPPTDDIFYYNSNVLRWWMGSNIAIRYDRMLPLSCMCANRLLALNHYKYRQQKITEWGLDHFRSREPRLARVWGYEPGTKHKKRGGLTDDNFDTWSSADPVIDIRHKNTFSSPKIKIEDFKHQPTGWKEIKIEHITYWNLKHLFSL